MTVFTSSINVPQTGMQRGFSLIEMAIVLVILGFLLGGMIAPLSSQREVSQRQAAERQLQEIRNALIGFAQANGHLPCPSLNGASSPNDGVAPATCVPAYNGVPYNTLGLQGTIIGTTLRDGWQRPIRYRLTQVDSFRFATGNMAGPTTANFVICSSSTGATSSACGNNNGIAQGVVAVILSEGVDRFGSADENQNTDAAPDPVFVTRTPDQTFDDILVWISEPALTYEVNRAGR